MCSPGVIVFQFLPGESVFHSCCFTCDGSWQRWNWRTRQSQSKAAWSQERASARPWVCSPSLLKIYFLYLAAIPWKWWRMLLIRACTTFRSGHCLESDRVLLLAEWERRRPRMSEQLSRPHLLLLRYTADNPSSNLCSCRWGVKRSLYCISKERLVSVNAMIFK